MIVSNNKVGSSFSSLQNTNQQALINHNQQQLQLLASSLPVSSRRVRDSSALLFLFAFLGFLAYVIWDGVFIKQADINLIVHGHDSYGNICGRNNKPIKFVEKSGKNYTSQAYTKYTLINAQFERYTLDSDRLRNGELFYVRQGALDGPPHGNEGARADDEHSPDERNSKISRAKARVASAAFRLSRRAPLAFGESELEAARRNQTLLKQLRSTLMYQYPPLYGYNNNYFNRSSSESVSGGGAISTAAAAAAAASAKQQQPQDQAKNTRIEASRGAATRGSTAADEPNLGARSFTVGLGQQQQQQQPPPRAAVSLARPIAADMTKTTTTRSSTVYFDDYLNETDRFEHMLIAPSNTNPRPRRPVDGFYANEVGSQLLYLTECVDFCPADHVELIFYRCMPRNWRFSLFPNAINVTRTFIDDILTDMSHCYKELIYTFSLALVLSLGLLIMLRYLASLIIWSCLATLVLLFLSMASYSWLNYYYLVLDLSESIPNNSLYSDKLASSDKWLIGAIFLTFVTFASVATILFMRKRILMVTMLFRESGKAIADMPLLLLQPVLTFATLVTVTALWAAGLVCLQSIKTPVVDMQTGFVIFKAETLQKIMKWYHIFAFLWVSHFAIACQHYVIGASVSKWYFSLDRYNLHSPIGSSVSELILYYLGSVALGSFLVAIFKVIKIVVRQIQYLVQRNCMQPHGSQGANSLSANQAPSLLSPASSGAGLSGGSSGSWCGSFTYLWRMFIWFFDNIVMIINRDAYVEVAIHGHSFLQGAQRALSVLASNPLRLLAIKSVGAILLVIAKLCVVFGTVSMAMVLLEDKSNQLNYSWSPLVVSALFAYVVAHWFVSVYEMVIDALFICYCEDFERSKTIERAAGARVNGSNFMAQILNNGQIY